MNVTPDNAEFKEIKIEFIDKYKKDSVVSCTQIYEKKEKLTIMRNNVVQVISNSTVMPFRWLKSSFRCFYCYEIFTEPRDLKVHNETHASNAEIHKIMSKYWEPYVYVDISRISCKLCDENVTTLHELIDHLISDHEMNYNNDIGSCIYAFRLNDLSVDCVECCSTYKTFGPLLVHTNKVHRGCSADILCDLCGQYFRTTHQLNAHIMKKHEKIPTKCSQCGLMISNPNHLRTHMQKFHDKKYKCFVCPDMFDSHYKRSQHMMNIHKNREKIVCPHCSKTFVFRSTMRRHVREKHLQEKNVVCSVCGWRAFEVNRLRRHLMKHSNERNFKCTACDKAFKTQKTMRQHFFNIHEKDSKKIGIADEILLQ